MTEQRKKACMKSSRSVIVKYRARSATLKDMSREKFKDAKKQADEKTISATRRMLEQLID